MKRNWVLLFIMILALMIPIPVSAGTEDDHMPQVVDDMEEAIVQNVSNTMDAEEYADDKSLIHVEKENTVKTYERPLVNRIELDDDTEQENNYD